jgi:hypothetical protein
VTAGGGGVAAVIGGPGFAIGLESNVTAPVSAKALPFSTAPVAIETDAWARMVPLKVEYVPRVAELPTCQKMLAAVTPPVRTTLLPVPVVSELATWKMKTLFAEPLSVRVPVMPKEDVELYRPGVRVCPLRSPATPMGDTFRLAASIYAALKSAWAETAGPSST